MKKQAGFSLVEISIVLVIVGLLLGSIMNGLMAYFQSSRISMTKKALDGAELAIIGFVATNGRFPCPDFDGDGAEDRNSNVSQSCVINHKYLPYTTLGVEREDAWGGLYMYAVDPIYADKPPAGVPPNDCAITFRLDSPDGWLDVETDDGAHSQVTVAVVYSIGLDNQSQQTDPDNRLFVAKKYSPPDSAVPFDDVVVRISSLTIKADMFKAGKLPEDPAICP
jgi:prepilin-type N-terminal cleavage/methylation domain-containing protein